MQRSNELFGNGFKLGARGLLAAALAVTALGLAAVPASAATVVVNTTTDQSLGSCSGSCSLRDAVATANPGDTIQVPAGHYVLTLGHIAITQSLTLAGSGARTTLIDGNNTSGGVDGGIFNMSGAINVELSDLSLINGVADRFGGAIEAAGLDAVTPLALTIRRCTVDHNRVTNGSYGGLDFVFGTLDMEESTFSNNTATNISGGLGADTVTGSIVNSTLSGNTAPFGGSAMNLDSSTLSLINNTITANHANATRSVLRVLFSQLTLSNNVIAANDTGDCLFIRGSTVTDHNLDSDNTCHLTGPGDLPGVAPLLGPLANNGGPTDSQALLAGSPAIDAGDNATCPATDQRGITRPQGPACDIGAFELTPQDQIAALIDQLNALITGGSLTQNQANPLITKLNQVVTKLDAGQTTAACGQLGAFINHVNADIGNGTLTPAQGQPLLDAVNALQASLGC